MTYRIAPVLVTLTLALGVAQIASGQAPDGADLYKRTCAQCHDNGTNRAPNRESFRLLAAERVLAAMETGSMITIANNRTAAERRAIAEFLTGKSLSNPLITTPPAAAMCSAGRSERTGPTDFNPNAGPRWTGWGQNANNAR